MAMVMAISFLVGELFIDKRPSLMEWIFLCVGGWVGSKVPYLWKIKFTLIFEPNPHQIHGHIRIPGVKSVHKQFKNHHVHLNWGHVCHSVPTRLFSNLEAYSYVLALKTSRSDIWMSKHTTDRNHINISEWIRLFLTIRVKCKFQLTVSCSGT